MLKYSIWQMFESKLKVETGVWFHNDVYVVHGTVGEDRAQGTCCCRHLLSDDHTVVLNFSANSSSRRLR